MFSSMLRSSNNSKSSVLKCKYTHKCTHPLTYASILKLSWHQATYMEGNWGLHKFRELGRCLTKFCTPVPNNLGTSVCNILHITLVAHRISRWLLDFLENLSTPKRFYSKHYFYYCFNLRTDEICTNKIIYAWILT